MDFSRLGLARDDRVLDLGCGAGRHAFEALRRGARVVAVDADQAELEGVAGMLGGGAAARADAMQLPFPDASFDRVIAAEVLEHVPRDAEVMAELARVLRPGGTMAVTVPRWGPEAISWALSDAYHARPGGHVRIYRRSQLLARLGRAGLRPAGAHHHAHALHVPYWWLRCLVGVDRGDHPAVRAYHRLLVWDIVRAPALTRLADRLLNPVLGKSLVVYLVRPG